MNVLEKYLVNVDFYKDTYDCMPSELGMIAIYKFNSKYKIVKTNIITNNELPKDNVFFACLIPDYIDMYLFIADMYFEKEDKDGLYDFDNQELIEILIELDFVMIKLLQRIIIKLRENKNYGAIIQGMKQQSLEVSKIIKTLRG